MSPRTTTKPTGRFLAGSALIMMLVLAPAISFACPTCFAASGANGVRAYYLSTMLLSTMPFLMIGLIASIAYAAKRRHSRQSNDEHAKSCR